MGGICFWVWGFLSGFQGIGFFVFVWFWGGFFGWLVD